MLRSVSVDVRPDHAFNREIRHRPVDELDAILPVDDDQIVGDLARDRVQARAERLTAELGHTSLQTGDLRLQLHDAVCHGFAERPPRITSAAACLVAHPLAASIIPPLNPPTHRPVGGTFRLMTPMSSLLA